jgi:hypothetical protein
MNFSKRLARREVPLVEIAHSEGTLRPQSGTRFNKR